MWLTWVAWHPDNGVGYVCPLCGFWLPVSIRSEDYLREVK